MNKNREGIVLIDQPFDTELIREQLRPLSICWEGDRVVTKYHAKLLSSSEHSEKYSILDFAGIVTENLPKIAEFIRPVSYDLSIFNGVQQLKIYADKIVDEGEVFQSLFILFSSSNGSYPVLFNLGLFRQVCSNGLMISTDAGIESKTKHYTQAIERKTQYLKEFIPESNKMIEEQLAFLRRLKREEISLQKIYSSLLTTSDNEPTKIAIERVRKLGKKLLESPSDALQSNLDERELRALTHPLELALNKESTRDILLPKIQVFNCYTEIFNRRLHAVNVKENNRIKEILVAN